MVIIPISGNKGAGRNVLVDDVDSALLNIDWYYLENGYAYNPIYKYIHQNVLPPIYGFIIDHFNSNKLDNQRHNLRYVTYSQNNINRKCDPDWRHITPASNGFKVHFTRNRKNHYLGYFPTYAEALKVRNNWLELNEPMYTLKRELY